MCPLKFRETEKRYPSQASGSRNFISNVGGAEERHSSQVTGSWGVPCNFN